jgi:hypothetical protein
VGIDERSSNHRKNSSRGGWAGIDRIDRREITSILLQKRKAKTP